MTKSTVSRIPVLFLVVTSHFYGVVTKMLVVANYLWESWISPVDYLVLRLGSFCENFYTNSFAKAFIGDI